MSDIPSSNPTAKSIIADLQNPETKIKKNAIKNIQILIDQIGHDKDMIDLEKNFYHI